MKLLLLLLLVWLPLLAPDSGRASEEEVQLSMEAIPAGVVYRDLEMPIEAKLHIGVSVPPGAQLVTPMINSRVTFPADMSFHPDPDVTPVCPLSRVGPNAGLPTGINSVVAACPRSVIGTGTARIHLARSAVHPTLDDPRLVIFNAGRTAQGRPRITIYGYSGQAASDVYMTGYLARNGELDIAMGVLPFDSAIGEFTLGIPGAPIALDGGEQVVGRDPGYLRAKCSTGSWTAAGTFRFATRNQSTGNLTSEPFDVDSNSSLLECSGRPGKVTLGAVLLKGSNKFRPGSTRAMKLVISNIGTATARKVRIRVSGGGTGSFRTANLLPRSSKAVSMKVRFPRMGPPRRVLKVSVDADGRKRVTTIRVKQP